MLSRPWNEELLYRHHFFIRYLTNDDPQKADRVERLLEQAARGKIKLMTAEMVLAEIVWVLESYYHLEKARIAEMLKAILSTPGLEVLNAKIVESALPYYSLQNIDFVDAYIVALMQKHGVSGVTASRISRGLSRRYSLMIDQSPSQELPAHAFGPGDDVTAERGKNVRYRWKGFPARG